MIAKNLEENKERMELSQKLLASEREIGSLKSKITKITLEKERYIYYRHLYLSIIMIIINRMERKYAKTHNVDEFNDENVNVNVNHQIK